MVDETNQPQEQPIEDEPKPRPQKARTKSSVLKYILLGLLVLTLAGASAAGAYFWRDNEASDFEKQQASDIDGYKNTISDLQKQLADALAVSTTDTAEDADTVCTEIAPSAVTIENIEASITSGNTAALEGYMASSVNVILAASEAYGAQTPTQAIADISSFLSDDLDSWDYDFSLPAATLSAYQSGDYADYFSGISVVGKASNDHVISFSFDCDGNIDTVFLSTIASIL